MTTTTQVHARQTQDAGRDAAALEVLALSSTEWRVRDTTLPEADGRSVLDVVQLIGDTYELMQIGSPLSRYYFANLEDAVGYLAAVR